MAEILTCTWAPTALSGPQLFGRPARRLIPDASGDDLRPSMIEPVLRAEQLGIDFMLVAQRWWGTGQEIEGSSYDCLAMTAYYAAITRRLRFITAIHPGFFLPAPIAKWGASIDRVSAGRWAINVTTGWHEAEFGMFGAELLEHDERYARSREFIDVLRGAWSHEDFSYSGRFYNVSNLRLEPRPLTKLEVWQGGQSEVARDMAASHSDWMFLNGGPPEKIGAIIQDVRARAARTGRHVRFALYSIPLCRETDAAAERDLEAMLDKVDTAMVERRSARTGGARGMWSSLGDRLTQLDTNEGFASRLIGSPRTILNRMRQFHELGVECFHLALHDDLFNREVLPRLKRLT
ncbi:MAG TPA: LLM class flavin-dependent oxidoreductase [Candidatus Binataceae bacterium]|nr:LLM class flavin-dependent oxidoreductase [Candidatus Binataceae bacterium]